MTTIAPRSAGPGFGERATWTAARVLIVVVSGLAVGAATLVLQRHLSPPWSGLVNAVSPWVAPAFLAGTLWRRPAAAALAGLAMCLLEVLGYYGLAALQGRPFGPDITLYWTAFAFIGGPVFGVAGWAWWRASGWPWALGAAAMPAAWMAEALVFFQLRWHRPATAALFIAIGVAAYGLLALRGRRFPELAEGLLVMVPLGIAGEVGVSVVWAVATRL